jgi:hypothetical protein
MLFQPLQFRRWHGQHCVAFEIVFGGVPHDSNCSLFPGGIEGARFRQHEPEHPPRRTAAALLSGYAATPELQTTPFTRLQTPPIQIIISDSGSLSVASLSMSLSEGRSIQPDPNLVWWSGHGSPKSV